MDIGGGGGRNEGIVRAGERITWHKVVRSVITEGLLLMIPARLFRVKLVA